jgi:hypothetical protein
MSPIGSVILCFPDTILFTTLFLIMGTTYGPLPIFAKLC